MKRNVCIVLYCLLLLVAHALHSQSLNIHWHQSIPTVTSFSSPRVADLNGDQVKDVVIGAGIEGSPTPSGIFAFDGTDGSLLWQRYARDQMYGSPLFQDITGDSVPEVFITGRDAQCYALDGSTGFKVWEFWSDLQGSSLDSGWYNFYLPQWIPDQNQDGYRDLLVTNGGDPTIFPADKNRRPGYLMALSGLDGSILQVDTMPDGQETYHSPLVVDLYNNGDLQVFWGSGGETVGGSYWRMGLADFMANGLGNAQLLLTDSEEGYIAVSSLVDLTGNGIPDLVVPQLNDNIIALEDGTGHELWRHTEPGTDCYVSPAIGQFTGDATPDVFVLASTGNWPFFQESIKLLIDGSTGQVVWSEMGYPFQMTSGVAIDWDEDGFDEIIFPNNVDTASQGTFLIHQLYLYDFNDQLIVPLDVPRTGAMVFSVPLITDLEGDNSLEMIFATSDNTKDWYLPDGFTLYRADLGFHRSSIAWGGYLGTVGDGLYPMNLQVSISEVGASPQLSVYPNPVSQTLFVRSHDGENIHRIELFDLKGKQVLVQLGGVHAIPMAGISSGVYSFRIHVGNRIAQGKLVKL